PLDHFLSTRIANVAIRDVTAMKLCLSPRSIRGLGPLTRVRHLCHRQTLHSEEYDDEEDKEIEESYDSNSVSEDAEGEDPASGTRVLLRGSRAPQAALVVGITVSAPLGLGYGALRLRELALEEDHVYTPPVQTPPSPEWTSGSLPISPSPFVVPSPISSPMILLTVPSPVATPATAETEGFLTKLGAQVELQGGLIRGHIVRLEELSPALFERYDRDIRELFTRSGAGENWDLRLQLAEERRARLELAEVVDSIRRGHEPRGGA
ncbi:hypothetical protein Tco_1217842, partial [Tanacetum coccineum]